MRPLQRLKADLRIVSNPEKRRPLPVFFQAGNGQCGEGDIFLGIMVPAQRRIA